MQSAATGGESPTAPIPCTGTLPRGTEVVHSEDSEDPPAPRYCRGRARGRLSLVHHDHHRYNSEARLTGKNRADSTAGHHSLMAAAAPTSLASERAGRRRASRQDLHPG